MKRKLSLLIAIIMVLSLLPAMSVSAATRNTMATGVVTVSDDTDWGDAIGSAPLLRIEKTDGINWSGGVFELSLTNAEWSFDNVTGGAMSALGSAFSVSSPSKSFRASDSAGSGGVARTSTANSVAYEFTIINDTTAQVNIAQGTNFSDSDNMFIPLIVSMSGAGTASVTITDISNSYVNGGTVNFANAAEGATVTTIQNSTTTFSNTLAVPTITIRETRAGAIDFNNYSATNRIRIVLPNGFEWVTTGTTLSPGTIEGRLSLNNVTFGGQTVTGDNGVLTITKPSTLGNTTAVGSIVIANAQIRRTGSVADTRTGDVVARIIVPGGTDQDITLGVFAARGVTIEAEDKALPEIVSGVYKTEAKTSSTQVLDVKITENSRNAWNNNTDAIFKLSDGAKFRAVEVRAIGGVATASLAKGNSAHLTTNGEGSGAGSIQNFGGVGELRDDTLTIRSLARNASTTSRIDMTLRIWVTTKPGFEGDIVFRSDEDNEAFAGNITATVGKSINPVTVTAETTPINLGYMRVGLNDIVLKENKAGAIKRTVSGGSLDVYDGTVTGRNKQRVELEIGNRRTIGVDFRDPGNYEVTAGDIVVDKYDCDDGTLFLNIKRESTVPSEIKLSGMTLDANRSLPEGKIDLRIGGSITANQYVDTADGGATAVATATTTRRAGGWDIGSYVAVPDYINIITAAPDKDVKYTTEVAVTIGSTTIVADGKESTIPVAPFIQDGYTMVPVRAVAVAIGVSDDQIHWDPVNKIVTVQDTGRGRQAQFQVGSNFVLSQGMSIYFEGPSAMIVDSRTFLPFRAMGELVLGCPVSWDEASRTAYYNRGADAAATTAAPAAPAETTEEATE